MKPTFRLVTALAACVCLLKISAMLYLDLSSSREPTPRRLASLSASSLVSSPNVTISKQRPGRTNAESMSRILGRLVEKISFLPFVVTRPTTVSVLPNVSKRYSYYSSFKKILRPGESAI